MTIYLIESFKALILAILTFPKYYYSLGLRHAAFSARTWIEKGANYLELPFFFWQIKYAKEISHGQKIIKIISVFIRSLIFGTCLIFIGLLFIIYGFAPLLAIYFLI